MAEWLMALVLKTSKGLKQVLRGFKSHFFLQSFVGLMER